MLRTVIALVLGAHGVGHLIGVVGGWANSAWGGSGESWLLTPALGRSAAVLEGLLWLLPAIGFIGAALALVGGQEVWRTLAIASAVASLVVIGLFPQQLPAGSMVGAIVVNVAVIVGLLVLHWPAPEAVGA